MLSISSVIGGWLFLMPLIHIFNQVIVLISTISLIFKIMLLGRKRKSMNIIPVLCKVIIKKLMGSLCFPDLGSGSILRLYQTNDFLYLITLTHQHKTYLNIKFYSNYIKIIC